MTKKMGAALASDPVVRRKVFLRAADRCRAQADVARTQADTFDAESDVELVAAVLVSALDESIAGLLVDYRRAEALRRDADLLMRLAGVLLHAAEGVRPGEADATA